MYAERRSLRLVFVGILSLRLKNQGFGEVSFFPNFPNALCGISLTQFVCFGWNSNLAAALKLRRSGQFRISSFIQLNGILE